MAIVITNKKQEVLVDEIDFKNVSGFSWYINKLGYVCNDSRPRKYLHRFIMGNPKGKQVDHANLDRLDNRRTNLRVCNNSQNKANQDVRKDSKSGFKGVTKPKGENKWVAYLRKDGQRHILGRFDNPIEAAGSYNMGALLHHGKFARLNKIK